MRVLVEFSIDADIIECPDFSIDKLQDYQWQFTEWLYDKNNEHDYWMYRHGEKDGCCYRAEAFVEWLNRFVLDKSEGKAKVLEKCVNEKGSICNLEYPKDIEDVIQEKIKHFQKWLREKSDEGLSKQTQYIEKYGDPDYTQYAGADWLNKFILNRKAEKAYVIKKQIDCDKMKTMPKIFF